ncbi:hypothetical protein IWX87_000829 [Polaromonas sp. CG_9.7]|nr:hypothetical protein [Polaromonas sp. CG_9.7]MBG6113082.1 hypothetical protein [Polaromonas sp. CG_9.2]MDH6185614.1 hypothetical protein [Polaromonas sp. CG_23.6]
MTTLVPMSHPYESPLVQHRPVSYYWSGDALRSRSVSSVVLSGTVDVPVLPARLMADWNTDISLRLQLVPGDVESLPLPRARARWPDYRQCVQAVSGWTTSIGLPGMLAQCDVALMVCRGARYHHDGAQYGSAAFCNLFLSDDKGLDLHFPSSGHRIPLTKGTLVIFDTGQPHAVVPRDSSDFDIGDFPNDLDCTQVFLTWELAIEHADVARVLGIKFDIDKAACLPLDEEQVWLYGARAEVCPASGRWRRVD